MRLAGAVLLEEHDEWAENRRYISETSMAKLTRSSPTEELFGDEAAGVVLPAMAL